jgi:septin family protein
LSSFSSQRHSGLGPSRLSRHLGESGLGKSTLINTLFNTPLYPPKEPVPPSAERPKTVAIESIGAGMIRLSFTRSLSP